MLLCVAVCCCFVAGPSVAQIPPVEEPPVEEQPEGVETHRIADSSVLVLFQGNQDGAAVVAAWEDPTPYLGVVKSFAPDESRVELVGVDGSPIYSFQANFDGVRPEADSGTAEVHDFIRFSSEYSVYLRLPRLDGMRGAKLFFGPDRHPDRLADRGPVVAGISPELLDYLTSESARLELGIERTRLMINGRSETRRDIVFVGDGFTPDLQDEFMYLAETVMNDLLAHEPFSTYSYTFNFRTAFRPSFERGISTENDRRNTAYDSVLRENNPDILYYDAAYPETQEDEQRIFNDAASGDEGVPDLIVLLTYDGVPYAARNTYVAVISAGLVLDRESGPQILARLLAGSANLGTEYPGAGTRGTWLGEPTNPNLTMMCEVTEFGGAPRPVKWSRWFPFSGVHKECHVENEGGGGHAYNVWHSGGPSCILGDMTASGFCAVCAETMTQEIASYSSMVGDVLPSEDRLVSEDGHFVFTVERADPAIALWWSVDGEHLQSGLSDVPGVGEFQFDAEPGSRHEVRLEYRMTSSFLLGPIEGSRTWIAETL